MSRLRPLGLLSLALSVVLLGCAGQPVAVSAPAAGVRAGKAARQAYPSPGEYVAFSLHVAQKLLAGLGTGPNYRVVYPEVYNLGGITRFLGLVYDRETQDLILVGRYDPDRQPLTLDDWVVALRARFIHNTWPVVSIDPTEETPKTEMQIVRFEGGIEDSQFGADLLEADYRLKQIAMGLLPSGIPELQTYWDLGMKSVQEGPGQGYKIHSRFWFYPVLPSVAVREDVAAIGELKVGVFTEVLAVESNGKKIEDRTTFQDLAGASFAKGVSENFEGLAKVHASFSRLQGLDTLVALTKAIEEMAERPDLSFWLQDYRVEQVGTQREVKVLRRKEEYRLQVAGRFYQGAREVSGGVQLIAIALRLKAGDVTALKEAVLKTRPTLEALNWTFVVGEWLISTGPGMLTMEDVVPLFTQALFVQKQQYYDDAITLYGKVIALKPDWDWPYNNRGNAYAGKGLYDQALADYDKVLELNPWLAEAYTNRGTAYHHKGQYDRAISDFNEALKLNPRFAGAYNNRGETYRTKGDYDQALADFNTALQIHSGYADAYLNRGIAYANKGQYDEAISDFNQTLAINPSAALAYNGRGAAYRHKGDYAQAISDFNKAVAINPRLDAAFNNRGAAYYDQRQYEHAIADYTKALEIDPRKATTYYNRAIAYRYRGQDDLAIADYTKTLEIHPTDANAYYNRGNAYTDKGQHDQAVADYTRALQIDRRLAEAYNNRGIAYAAQGQYERAIADYNEVLKLNPRFAAVYNNRGEAYGRRGLYDHAIADYNKALELNLQSAEVYTNRGVAYHGKGHYDRAIADFNQAIERNPRFAAAYVGRGIAYMYIKGRDTYNQIVSDFSLALEINPQDAGTYVRRGLIYYANGKYDEAIHDFNHVLERNPSYDYIVYVLKGDAYKKVGRIKDAVEAYKRFVQYAPHKYSESIDYATRMINELEGRKLQK